MTKADLLRKLEAVPMNAPVVFALPGDEFEILHAFTVTGPRGLCLVLSDAAEARSVYEDAEEVFR